MEEGARRPGEDQRQTPPSAREETRTWRVTVRIEPVQPPTQRLSRSEYLGLMLLLFLRLIQIFWWGLLTALLLYLLVATTIRLLIG